MKYKVKLIDVDDSTKDDVLITYEEEEGKFILTFNEEVFSEVEPPKVLTITVEE